MTTFAVVFDFSETKFTPKGLTLPKGDSPFGYPSSIFYRTAIISVNTIQILHSSGNYSCSIYAKQQFTSGNIACHISNLVKLNFRSNESYMVKILAKLESFSIAVNVQPRTHIRIEDNLIVCSLGARRSLASFRWLMYVSLIARPADRASECRHKIFRKLHVFADAHSHCSASEPSLTYMHPPNLHLLTATLTPIVGCYMGIRTFIDRLWPCLEGARRSPLHSGHR